MAYSGQLGTAVLLGLVQALTEFLPVSSSGHLVIVKTLFKVTETGITLEIVTHLGTVLAVVVYLRKRILNLARAAGLKLVRPGKALPESEARDFRLVLLLVAGSLPAAILGLAVRNHIEALFQDIVTTAAMLVLTGCFVLATGKLARERTGLGLRQALGIGVAQAIAIVPGISRSGLTVGAGLALGVNKREAFEFSLLLSVPAVLGATLLEAIGGRLGGEPGVIAVAAATAFLGGYLAISLLARAVVKNKFHLFGYYLIPFGLLVILISRLA
jgi:undecaprenyl-diphosphatase